MQLFALLPSGNDIQMLSRSWYSWKHKIPQVFQGDLNNFLTIAILSVTATSFDTALKIFDFSFYVVSDASTVNYPQTPMR